MRPGGFTRAAARWAAGALLGLVVSAGTARGAVREPLSDWLTGLGDAAHALDAGDAAAAETGARRALSARPRGPAAALASAALGLALQARGSPADAAEALETALGGAPVPGRAHLSFHRAEALLASGQAHVAARVFGQAAAVPDLALSRRARLREAEALLAAGLPDEAVSAYDAALAASSQAREDPAARLALGRALRAAGAQGRAVQAWRSLWNERPEAPEAASAEALLLAWRASGGPVPPFTAAEHAERAGRLLEDGWPQRALTELSRAAGVDPAAPPGERDGALKALALLAAGRTTEALQVAAPLATAAEPGARRGALLVLARAAAREGRTEEATRRYAEIARTRGQVPGLPPWRQRDLEDESAFLSAWLWYDAGDYDRAAGELDTFARVRRGSRRTDDALWFAAWSRYRLGRRADAVRGLLRLVPGPLADASAYWRGRIASAPARQKALYRQALRLGGDGWYALLARARLSELGEPVPRDPGPRSRPLPEVNNSASAARLSVAVELLGLGLRSDALDELRDLSRGPRARRGAPLLAELAAFAGDPELPFIMARDHLVPTRRVIRWGHPRPYAEEVLPAASALGLDPSLAYAVMRRESRFDSRARSGADARGLLQLRPATAERTAALIGLPGEAWIRLDDPRVNLPLGVHYLALLGSRFGDPVVALSAYNAGPAAASAWSRARAGQPLDAWVESIPYRETREYVKIVSAEWNLYRMLAGEPPAPVQPGRPVPAPGPGVAY